MVKYAPRKVYIRESGGYVELSYTEFCRCRESDQTYMDKLFIPIQGCLLEVVREQYTDFYRDKERWRYLQKLDTKNRLLSLDGFTDSEGNPLDFITDEAVDIAETVVNAVMAKIMDDNFVEYVADAVMDIQSRESSVLPALRKQLEEAESGITNMLNAIQMGIINASTKQRLDELEERKKDIELQIIQEEMKHPAVSREDVIYFVCRFRSLDTSKLDARRRLIDSFVNAVTIFDDYILITFNYKEGETRIDFADIESSDLQSVGGPPFPEKPPKKAVFLRY